MPPTGLSAWGSLKGCISAPDLARLREIKQRVDPSARWSGTSPYPDGVDPRTRRLVTSLVLAALVAIVVVAALLR
jgi:hypothetical protein